jgi:hypothetical protein
MVNIVKVLVKYYILSSLPFGNTGWAAKKEAKQGTMDKIREGIRRALKGFFN